ncbi:MAG: peptide chain release factor 1, partial [Pseudomonadota bacterium]
LEPIVATINEHQTTEQTITDLSEMLADNDIDDELKQMAKADLVEAKESISKLTHQVKVALLPKDQDDNKNVIVEVRAGTGGDEAGLFASELFRMYQRFADDKGWRFEIIAQSETGIGGLKEGSASISGSNVFALMKFESGVHRVQRVPATESGGRIHTSAATVAVLPEAEEIDININQADLRIDVYRASGPGGQSVNTTDSAVRIVHIPTGIKVEQQDEKSQHKNKAKALKILMARLYDHERQKADQERSADRKSQVGSGDRSERIRTYNYPQDRITDHRINFTCFGIPKVVGEGQLSEIIEALIAEDEARKLSAEFGS